MAVFWTPDKLEILRSSYKSMTYHELARLLGTTEHAVRNKCYRLKLHKDEQEWTEEEVAELKRLYSQAGGGPIDIDALAERLGRSRWGVALKASRLGLTDQHRRMAKETVVKLIKSPSRYIRTMNGLRVSTNGGYREDLGIYVRSTWEANYARFLNWLQSRGQIASWEYEADTFEFPVKRGTRFYTPDFKVTYPDGRKEYHEVKGYMNQKSRTALDRMARYYPDVKVIVIDGAYYRDLRRKLGRAIPGWEDPPNEPAWTDEKEVMLAAMWVAGVPAKEIAEKLGKTVNAVAVRAQRLGLRRPKSGISKSRASHGNLSA